MRRHPDVCRHLLDEPVRTSSAIRREFWGGVTLLTMWLAVLLVAIFGGNIQTSDAGGGTSSAPVVVVVAVVALPATISVGRWAFGAARRES